MESGAKGCEVCLKTVSRDCGYPSVLSRNGIEFYFDLILILILISTFLGDRQRQAEGSAS